MAKKERIILGIDPGSRIMGYAIVKASGNLCTLIQTGVLRLHKHPTHYERLNNIDKRLTEIMKEYRADEVAVEAPFYGKNVQSMLKLGRAQGAAIVAALRLDLPVFEYEPRKVKKAVTGKGAASKEQVSGFLRVLFNIDKSKEIPLDATDALSVAFCHYISHKSITYIK